MRKTVLLFSIATASGALGLFVAGGCSLGLDETKIPGFDAGVVEAGDAAVDAPNPTVCKADPDCVPKGTSCLTGKCDTQRGQCVYTLCPASTCNASVCDTKTQACSAPTAYFFHAGTFKETLGNVGCGGGGAGARKCFAAVYPFVFIGTQNGVVAYPVADPVDGSPPSIQIQGLPFLPSFVVASGSMVYFVGPVEGVGPSFKVPIATLAVPGDPTVAQMTASTYFENVSVPSIDLVFPDTAGGIYLVQRDAPAFTYPTAHVTPPLVDLGTLTFEATAGITTGASVVAASGTRTITYRPENGGAFDAFFSLETQAGTSSAQNAGEKSTVGSMGTTSTPVYFAQSPTGGLLWSTTGVSVPDGGSPSTVSARLAWVLVDQNATNFDATTHIDVQTYTGLSGVGGDIPGPIAWIDDNDAIVIAAAQNNTAQSIVEVASRNGTPTIVNNRNFTLTFHPSELAVQASNGFGYVLTPDTSPGANVHIFGTSCNNN